MGRFFVNTLATLTAVLFAVGCSKTATTESSSTAAKTLFVATGSCNAGFGAAAKTTYVTASATRTIERFDSSTGANQGFLVDFTISNFLTGMNPQTMIDNGDTMYIQMENPTTTTERSILRMPKSDPLSYIKYYTNATPFSGVLRGMAIDADGSFIVGVTTKLEKISSQPVRVPAGANPWVSVPAGTCANSVTGMTSVQLLSPYAPSVNGKIMYTHQSAAAGAANQRLGIVSANGYFAAADCINGYQISSVAHTRSASSIGSGAVAFNANGTSPTSSVYIPMAAGSAVTGKLVVSYSNDQNGNNAAGVYNLNHAIVMWDVTETSATVATLTNPVILYDNTSVIYGVSAMVYDASTSSLYVATGGEPGVANMATNGVGYNIEKFTLDYNTPLLTRVSTNNQPFIRGAQNTKCISGMMLGNIN